MFFYVRYNWIYDGIICFNREMASRFLNKILSISVVAAVTNHLPKYFYIYSLNIFYILCSLFDFHLIFLCFLIFWISFSMSHAPLNLFLNLLQPPRKLPSTFISLTITSTILVCLFLYRISTCLSLRTTSKSTLYTNTLIFEIICPLFVASF